MTIKDIQTQISKIRKTNARIHPAWCNHNDECRITEDAHGIYVTHLRTIQIGDAAIMLSLDKFFPNDPEKIITEQYELASDVNEPLVWWDKTETTQLTPSFNKFWHVYAHLNEWLDLNMKAIQSGEMDDIAINNAIYKFYHRNYTNRVID